MKHLPTPITAIKRLTYDRLRYMNLSLENKITAGFVLLLLVIGMVGLVSHHSTRLLAETAFWVNHSEQVLAAAEILKSDMTDVETGARGFALTGKEEFLEPYRHALSGHSTHLQHLRELVADNPRQLQRLMVLAPLLADRITEAQTLIDVRDDEGFAAASQRVAEAHGRQLQDRIRQVVNELQQEEVALRQQRERASHEATRFAQTFSLLVGVATVVGFSWAWVMILRDLAVRKRLAEVQSHFSALIASSDDAIMSENLNGSITSWNAGAERMFGYSAAEAIGRPMSMLIPPEHSNEEAEILARIGRGEHIGHFETVRLTKAGVSLEISATFSSIKDASGKIIGISNIAHDISERKRMAQAFETASQDHAFQTREQELRAAELEQRVMERTAELRDANQELLVNAARLRALFESLPGLYLVLKSDLTIVTASEAYLQATMTRREEIAGKNIFDVFPDNPESPDADGVSNLRASFERVRLTGAPDTMPIQKYDVRRPDGIYEQRYWSPINSPLLGPDRQLEYIIHRVEDVTEFVIVRQGRTDDSDHLHVRLEQMEAEVFQSTQRVQAINQQLHAANKELEAFSYSVSHDLRAPLRSVDSFSRIVLEDYGPQLGAEGQRLLNVVRSEAHRMGQLIDDLLAFSRLGRQSMKLAECDLTQLAQDVYDSLDAAVRSRIREFVLKPLPRAVGDRAMLRQVLINLLSNAVKFTGHQTAPRIEVGGSTADGFNTYYVKDNGVGFDPRFAEKLFQVFQRLHSEEEFEGTGVGLALVQRIVSRHGGKVWAEAELNAGATFYFSLPTGSGS